MAIDPHFQTPSMKLMNDTLLYPGNPIYIYNYITVCLFNTHTHLSIITVIYQSGYNVFHRPHPVFSSILYVHVSEMLCTCQRCCARFRDVVHVSEMLCTCHRCCAHLRDVVHVSEMLCTFPSSCAHFPAVVHVSQKLCACHRSCARFTSALITFLFNCIHTERILISKSIGATKHVLPINLYDN